MQHIHAELFEELQFNERVTKREINKLTDKEIDGVIVRYLLRVPKGLDATRKVKIRHIVQNARKFGNVYPFDKYAKTPKGIRQRIQSLAKYATVRTVNKAIQVVGQKSGIKFFVYVTRPDLSKTGPCIICAPDDGKKYRPGQFMPSIPRHSGCVCQWDIER